MTFSSQQTCNKICISDKASFPYSTELKQRNAVKEKSLSTTYCLVAIRSEMSWRTPSIRSYQIRRSSGAIKNKHFKLRHFIISKKYSSLLGFLFFSLISMNNNLTNNLFFIANKDEEKKTFPMSGWNCAMSRNKRKFGMKRGFIISRRFFLCKSSPTFAFIRSTPMNSDRSLACPSLSRPPWTGQWCC